MQGFEREVSPVSSCIGTCGPRLVALFGEAMGYLGGHWQALRVYCFTLVYVLAVPLLSVNR